MRLIDADKLAEEIADSINDASIQNDELSLSILRVFKKTVDDEPTIDAEPVKRGKWIHHAGMNSKCSCCGRYFPVAEFEQRPFDVNFCIHCGARMEGSDTNA